MKWLLFGDFAKTTGETEVHVYVEQHATVGDALRALIERYPAIEEMVLADGELRRDVHLMHNHHPVLEKDGLETELVAGDELALFGDVDS